MFRRRNPSRSSSSRNASHMPASSTRASRQRRRGLRCILECIEQLETRRLLTTLQSTAGIPRTFEYLDGTGKTMRIVMQGNIRAEFIAAEVPDNSKTGGNLPHIKLRPRDLVPASGAQNQQNDGYDLFEIYVAQSDINSSISIAQVPASGNDRPMQPFSGTAGDFRITNATTFRSETVDPGNATGAAILGTRTGDTIMNTDLEQDIAITSIGFKQRWGIRPVVPSGKFDAGLIVAPGNDLGQFLFGGTVIGRVSIGGNMNLFYAGALWTGDATGEAAEQGPVSRHNFDVEGDLRNLITIGSIGTADLPDATQNPESMQVKTGVDIHVKGRLGQIMTKNAWLGAVTVDGDPTVKGTGLPQEEIEARRFPAPTDSQSFFEGFPFDFNPQLTKPTLGDNPIFSNDTPDTAQYLGTFRSSHPQNPLGSDHPFPAGLNQNDAIELDGVLNGDATDQDPTATARDDVDYYAVALMGGQTIDVQLTSINPEPTFLTAGQLDRIHVGIFDPDNRLIATDYNNNAQATIGQAGQNALKTHFENPTFQFTAQRPGIYKFAVANDSDANFNGALDEPRGGIFFPGSFHEYRLDITHTANIALGGLVATNSIAFTDGPVSVFGASTTPSLDVMNGDVGAVISTSGPGSDTLIFNDTPTTGIPFTTPWRIRKGNLRAVVAPSIGIANNLSVGAGDPLLTLGLVVPKGSVGLLRATGTAVQQTLSVNADLVNPTTGAFDASNIVGVDYQVVDAAAGFASNLMAGRGIGTIRCDSMSGASTPCRLAVNADNRNSDGFIDLIDVRTQMGTLTSGGPQITTGDNGNVRYIVAPPNAVFRDRFFGGGQIQPTTFNAGQVVRLTDDSGTSYKLIPGPQLVDSTGAVLQATTLTTTTYPIRDKGGQVLINVTQTPATIVNADGSTTVGGNQSLTVDSGPAGKSGFVEVGTIDILSPGTTYDFDQFNRIVTPVAPTGGATTTNVTDDVILKGKAVVDVWNITANAPTGGGLTGITSINNQTVGGEIANVQAAHIGSIDADTVGIPKSHTGALVEGVDVRITGLPFNNQRVLINAAGTSGTGAGFIGTINARGAVGNVHAASIGNINANSDRRDAKGVFEGIAAPIWAQQTGTTDPKQGNIHAVNIGEGIPFGGSGNDVFSAGLFADGLIDSVTNAGQATGSDIRGPVVALRHTTDSVVDTVNPDGTTTHQQTPLTGIGTIKLTNGSIVDGDIMVVLDYIDALETVQAVILAPATGFSTFGTPIDNIQSINLTGIGGILGSTFVADNMGPINIRGGFGMVASEIRAGGNATTSGIVADGFGIRQSYLDIGAALGSLIATGTGKRLSVTEYDPGARLSERNVFDPFSGRLLDPYNDLHKFFGTSKSNPKRKGKTEAGVIADSTIIGGRRVDQIDAYRIIGGPDIIDTITGEPAMRIAFGNQIGKITVRDVIDGLQVTSGGISLLQTGNDVSALNVSSSGRINKVIIGGNLKSNSTIRATGSDGRIDTLTTKRSLMGRVNASVMIGTVTSGDLGSHDLSSSNDIGTLIINGSILSGATVRARDTIQSLNVGKNIQENATVQARKIENQHIKGQVFGDVVITG